MKRFLFTFIGLIIFHNGFCQVNGGKTDNELLISRFYNTDSLKEKQSIFDQIEKTFPETLVKNNKPNYDELRRILALNYLVEGNTLKYNFYIDLIKDKVSLSKILNNVASHWVDESELIKNAEQISVLSLNLNNYLLKNAAKFKPTALPLNEWLIELQQRHINFTDTYSFILYKQGNVEKAVSLLKPVYQELKQPTELISEHYSLMLTAAGESKKAIEVIESAIEKGFKSPIMLGQLRKNYIAINGSAIGYERYYSNLEIVIKNNTRNQLIKNMISEPAPFFALKDTAGKVVSLDDFKGKILIIDFWANWCVPCKESFPGMEVAINKFKNNENIKFLFIDTWETEKDSFKAAKKYISSTKYPFHYVFDERILNSKQYKTANAFYVKGIPEKFIIDKKGFIRFKDSGYAGSANQLVDDISTMIELIENN
ncbi:redoxin domain-containing protein [Pedobacter sp. P351]|uniref:TlpA family protein disulfide reductase n=1 Tax=Pedobacter superstes TaxID=3133441 RepID=UPI0030B40161